MADKSTTHRNVEFYKIYNEKILPILESMENKRKKTKATIILYILLAVLLNIWCYLPYFNNFIQTEGPIYDLMCSLRVITNILSILLICIIMRKNKSFKSSLKDKCLSYVIKAFDGLYVMSPNTVIPDRVIKKSTLFKEYNSVECDDAFAGMYNGIKYTISETKLLMRSKALRGDRRIVYKGLIVFFQLNKALPSPIVVKTKNDFNITNKFSPLQLVDLGGLSFARYFNAYSSDRAMAMSVLTSSFMDRLDNVKKVFGAKKIKCSFYGDKLIIAIPAYTDLFEIGSVYTPLTDPKFIQKFYNELSSIYDLIDILKLYEKNN